MSTAIERLKHERQLYAECVERDTKQLEREGRAQTPDERELEQKRLAMITQLGTRIEKLEADNQLAAGFDAMYGRHRSTGSQPEGARGSSAGDLFATAPAYVEWIKAGGHRSSGSWRSPAVEIPYASMFAATLTEDPASGGKLVVPDYRPGIVPLPMRPIVVMDLLKQGTTDSNVVTTPHETLFTNAAAPVAEGAAKPESALTFDQTPEPVNKIAHWLPVTEELLEDEPAIRSYIDARLRLGVQLAEDDQILNGNGTPPNFRGILNRSGLAPTLTQGAGENVADAILRQIGAIATTAMVAPTAVVMNPADWFPLQALKTSGSGEYIGGSPFGAVTVPTLWGLPVAVTSGITAKTALVGAFASMAQFFRKGGLRVEASNSHQDFFIKNLVAIRAEERGALAVYRPAAFGKVTLT